MFNRKIARLSDWVSDWNESSGSDGSCATEPNPSQLDLPDNTGQQQMTPDYKNPVDITNYFPSTFTFKAILKSDSDNTSTLIVVGCNLWILPSDEVSTGRVFYQCNGAIQSSW